MQRLVIAAVFLGVFTSASARADEDRLRLMREPTSYTQVVDAADEGDPFDLNLTIGFTWSQFTGDIRRQAPSPAGQDRYFDIGHYSHTRIGLEIGLDIGVYKDLAVFARLPVVLSDDRSISAGTDAAEGLADNVFSVPFNSPTRSGLDTLGLGIAWAPLNQNRVPEVPNWVIIAEAVLPIGDVMRPCDRAAGTSCNPGISRGTTAINFSTRLSRRMRYVEPYFGLGAHAEFATAAKEQYRPGGNLIGFQHAFPQMVGEFTLGAAFIPWEAPARFQRFVIDMRMDAQYFSDGHDYSPLFDALGSSQLASMTSLQCEDGGPIAACDPAFAQVPFTGLTDISAYGQVTGRVTLELQPAQYVRFGFSTGFTFQTAHDLTTADGCNANENAAAHPERVGPCTNGAGVSTGIFNPHYRETIDEPGHRFRIDNGFRFDLMATAVAQF
jgi:hypothetical protein